MRERRRVVMLALAFGLGGCVSGLVLGGPRTPLPQARYSCPDTLGPFVGEMLMRPGRNAPLSVRGQQFHVPPGAVSDTVTIRMTVPPAGDLRIRVEAVARPDFAFNVGTPAQLTLNYQRCRAEQFGADTVPVIHQSHAGGVVTHTGTKEAGAPRASTAVERLSEFLLDVPI